MDLINSLTFQKFKEMTNKGIYVPVLIEENKIQGFVVRA